MQKYFRPLGWLEAASMLLLLFVAMPLKYLAGIPEAVRIVGSLHGGLFVLYVLAATLIAHECNWAPRKLFAAYVAAVIPFGPLVFDREFRSKTSSA